MRMMPTAGLAREASGGQGSREKAETAAVIWSSSGVGSVAGVCKEEPRATLGAKSRDSDAAEDAVLGAQRW